MWSYHNPVEVTFGAGALTKIGSLIGGRAYALVTYDEPSFAALGQRVADLAGRPRAVIDAIRPNPDFAQLTAACGQFADTAKGVETIVALGGGSVIDAAKVLAAANGDFATVRTYLQTGEGANRLAAIPIIAVPTTAGTGSEVTSWAAVWDSANGKKYSLARPELYPRHALVDPELMLDMPRPLTIATGLDALSHALESLWNRNANPVSSNFAIAAARALLEALPLVLETPRDLPLRTKVARAALMAGFAFSNTKTALAHSLSYPITLGHGVAHGIACSFSLPMVMRAALGENPDCDAALRAIFGKDLYVACERLSAFLASLGVSDRPSDHGVAVAEWQDLVARAFRGERGRNFIGTQERFLDETGASATKQARA